MAQTPEETIALLNRLSQKPGVQSTLIISRSDGAIVRTSGLISHDESAGEAPEASASPNGARKEQDDDTGAGARQTGLRNADDVARMVRSFFGAAGGMVDEMMGTEDEVKLLRLRTRRNELVIVPDSRFLLVVIHDTPPA